METIITIFTILSMYMNTAESIDNRYCYNADIENGIVNTLYIYEKSGDKLNQYLTYDFKYDEKGRLTEKTINKWDCWKRAYCPSKKIYMTYTSDGYELSLCLWNQSDKNWNPSSEKAIYHYDNGHLTEVSYLAREKGKDYYSVNSLRIMDPHEDLLFAGTHLK